MFVVVFCGGGLRGDLEKSNSLWDSYRFNFLSHEPAWEFFVAEDTAYVSLMFEMH